MRLIDADAFIEEARNIRDRKDMQHIYLPIHMMKLVIDEMPTVEAEPVRHGYWIYCRSKNNNIKQYQCSECGKHMWTMDKYLKEEKYCFKCGAKMKGDNKSK